MGFVGWEEIIPQLKLVPESWVLCTEGRETTRSFVCRVHDGKDHVLDSNVSKKKKKEKKESSSPYLL